MNGTIFSLTESNDFMKLIFFIVAGALAMTWLIGFFVFKAGMFIHISMMSSVICCIHAVMINPKQQLPPKQTSNI
ncbi:hypothetical protein [Terrimonas pollutisoli]|uniref:hypothetical protein n=1 Tax=Terrimonas pollutisoli TaxID=3034147 RepID=UPI0023EB3AEA|nr:hypothetical protein [Terrimonas sp. H1YJ31]